MLSVKDLASWAYFSSLYKKSQHFCRKGFPFKMDFKRVSVFVFCLLNISLVKAADSTDIARLRAQILNNYDATTRPVQKYKDTINVEIHFLDNGGMYFDEEKGVMTLYLLTGMTWEDQHVKWDPLSYGNLTEITFSPRELWRPDITVINNYDTSEIDHFGNTLMIATSAAEVWWIPPTKFQVRCPTDFKLWPYDKQRCWVQVSNWAYHSEEVNLNLPENYTTFEADMEWQEHVTESREWKTIERKVTRKNQTVYCCPKVEYIDIFIGVEIQRKSNSHTAAVTVVGLGISAAILISFWLNPFSEERIPVTMLTMLLNSLYLQYMYRAIPNNGATVPLAICFFRDSLVMVTFAFAWTVAIRHIAKTKRYTTVPLPDFIQNFLSSFGATLLCLNPRPQSKAQMQKNESGGEGDDGDGSELVGNDADFIQQDWEWLARLLDRLAFFGYLITYVIFIIAFL